jgi:mannose-1-phosphate guanylyltransferase
MKALLLAGGLGTRLRPLTFTVPKCLVPIKGQPLLKLWLDRLSDAGINQFLINTHHLADQVTKFIDESPYRESMKIVNEQVLLGTAGTVISNINFFGGVEGLVIHADNYCMADIREFIYVHQNRPPECLMTMMTFRTDTPCECGIVELDARGVVVEFHEKTICPPGNLANGAVYILTTELLQQLEKKMNKAKDFSTEVLPLLVGRIYTYETTDTFMDIGTWKNYDAVQQ